MPALIRFVFTIVSVSVFCFSTALAALEQDIVASWSMIDESCSDGSRPAGRHEELYLTFDGKQITTRILSQACWYQSQAPYEIKMDRLAYTVHQITEICGPKERIYHLNPPDVNNHKIAINGAHFRISIEMSLENDICPAGTDFNIDFARN